MVEDIGSDGFVIHPLFVECEAIDFQWQAFVCGWQLSYHHGQLLVDFGVLLDIKAQVLAKNTNVGEVSAIGQDRLVDVLFGVIIVDFRFFFTT